MNRQYWNHSTAPSEWELWASGDGRITAIPMDAIWDAADQESEGWVHLRDLHEWVGVAYYSRWMLDEAIDQRNVRMHAD